MEINGAQPISVGIWNEAKEQFDDAEQTRFVTSAGYTIVVCRDFNGHRIAIAFDKDGKPVSIGL